MSRSDESRLTECHAFLKILREQEWIRNTFRFQCVLFCYKNILQWVWTHQSSDLLTSYASGIDCRNIPSLLPFPVTAAARKRWNLFLYPWDHSCSCDLLWQWKWCMSSSLGLKGVGCFHSHWSWDLTLLCEETWDSLLDVKRSCEELL